MIEQALKQETSSDLICLHIIYYKSNKVAISIGIGNFVADILVIGVSVKTHIGAPLLVTLRQPLT